jgi:UDP-N-acetyl-D-galactosamine dehydrogenase
MLGITFKENCPDVRNTKVVDVISALKDFGLKVSIYDPWAEPKEVMHEYGLTITNTLPNKKFDAVVLGVSHNEFTQIDLNAITNAESVIYDVKGVLASELVDGKLKKRTFH